MERVSRVFLCHNSSDKESIQSLALSLLKSSAVRSWLDRWEIPGGQDWEEHIRREFANSWACLVFVGPSGFGPFQRIEIGWAEQRRQLDPDYPVVPVILPGVTADGLEALNAVLPKVHWINLENGWSDDEALAPLLKALRGDRPGPPALAISVAVTAEQWDVKGRDHRSPLLLRGQALRDAQRLLPNSDIFDPLSLAFITASATAEQQRSRRTVMLLATLAIVLIAIAVWANEQRLAAEASQLAEAKARRDEELQRRAAEQQRNLALAAKEEERVAKEGQIRERANAERERDVARTQRNLAEERRQLAESRAIAAEARRNVSQELVASMASGVRAYEVSATTDARTALLDAFNQAIHMKLVLRCAPGEKATGVALAPDMTALAYSCRGTRTTVLVVSDLQGHPRLRKRFASDVRQFVFVDADRLAVADGSQVAILSTSGSGTVEAMIAMPTVSALASSLKPDTLYVSAGPGEIRLLEGPCCGRANWTSRVIRAGTGQAVSELLVRRDALLEAHLFDGTVEVFDDSGKPARRGPLPGPDSMGNIVERPCEGAFPEPSRRYHALAWSASGEAFGYATEDNRTVVGRKEASGCFHVSVMPGHTHNLLDLALSRDGRYAVSAGALVDADDQHGVVLWDLEQVHPLAERVFFDPASRWVSDVSLALSNDLRSWACAGCSTSVIWDGTAVTERGNPPRAIAIALSPDTHQLYVGLEDGRVQRYHRTNAGTALSLEASVGARPVRLWAGHGGARVLAGSAVSHLNGDAILSRTETAKDLDARCIDAGLGKKALIVWEGDRSKIHVRHAATGLSAFQLPPDAGSCGGIAVAAEAGMAIRVSSGYEPMLVTETVLRTRSKTTLQSWPNPLRAPTSGLKTILRYPRLSDDGRVFAAVSDNNAVALFDVAERRLIGTLPLTDVRSIALSADGRHLLTFSPHGVLRWSIGPEALATRAAALSPMAPSIALAKSRARHGPTTAP